MTVRSGPGPARTILLFHTISARPSKQPRMVGSVWLLLQDLVQSCLRGGGGKVPLGSIALG